MITQKYNLERLEKALIDEYKKAEGEFSSPEEIKRMQDLVKGIQDLQKMFPGLTSEILPYFENALAGKSGSFNALNAKLATMSGGRRMQRKKRATSKKNKKSNKSKKTLKRKH